MNFLSAKLKTLLSRRKASCSKGVITVEAAIVLPVFLCIIISLVFIIKAVYTYELIQHAITETADEMASAGYILHVSGLAKMNDTLDTKMEEKSRIFKDHMDAIFESFESIDGLLRAGEAIEDMAADPAADIKGAAFMIAGGVYDDLKTIVFTPLVKIYMEKYLVSGSSLDADKRLKALNVHNGLSGLDFSMSEFLVDRKNEIDIIVKYKIDLPVPLKIFPDLQFEQRASARAWMGGDGALEKTEGEEVEDIWGLDNFTRGRKIRSLFGANLPFNYPVIAKFDRGTATMIKSMDLTAESYKTSKNISNTLDDYLEELYRFAGQDEPWGSKKILIRQQDIKQKELLLVIPKNQLGENTEALLESYVDKAQTMGIRLVIERYGTKKMEKEEVP